MKRIILPTRHRFIIVDGIRVLYVDDEPGLLDVARIFLEQTGEFSVDTVQSAPVALDILAAGTFDAIISDFQMPGMDGIEFLKRVRAVDKAVPFILFTGRGREEVVIEAINNGADFYLQKGGDPKAQFAELAHKVRQSVLMKKTQMTLAEQDQRYHDLQNASDLIQSVSPDGHFLFVNQKWLDTLGYTEADLKNLTIFDIIHKESLEHCSEVFRRVTAGESMGMIEAVFRTREGVKVYVQGMATCKMAEGKPQYTRGIFTDVTFRKWAEIELVRKNEELVAAVRELTATEEELRHNYELLAAKEQALRESEEKYRLITEVSDDVIYMVDLQGTITYVSPRIARYGYRPEEVISHNFAEFLAEADVPDAVKDFRATRATRKQNMAIVRIRDKAGNIHWIEDNGVPVVDASGSVVALTGILRDITGRREVEEAQRETEKKFRTIFENSPYPIAINSLPDNTFLEVNRAFLDVSGYTPQEILGKTPVSLGLISLTEAAKLISHRVLTGKIENVPLALTAKEGRRIHVLFTTLPVMIDNRPATMTVTAEVTKLKRIEEELLKKNEDLNAVNEELTAAGEELRHNLEELEEKEEGLKKSEEKFRALVEFSLEGILITDFHGKILFLNRAAGRMVDVENYEAVTGRRNVMEFISPESLPDVLRDFTNVAHGTDTYLASYRLITATKRDIWVESIGKRIPFEDTTAVLISLRDITDRRRAGEALRQANKKLNLLSGITRHDIKNQLLTLDGFIALLRKKIPDPAYDDYFSRISGTSSRIASLIQFTKEYEVVGVHAPAWQDIRTLVDEAGRAALNGKVTLKNDLPAGTEVFADPLIARVFFNLLDNAQRHGGRITTIRFFLDGRDGKRVIVCADDGDGVSAAEKERIFDLGFGKNTGFGLAISREILDITGITIKETGEAGNGARFEVAVPESQTRSWS